ncbi:hypothetical protein YC2023_046788 [Brassica napus]
MYFTPDPNPNYNYISGRFCYKSRKNIKKQKQTQMQMQHHKHEHNICNISKTLSLIIRKSIRISNITIRYNILKMLLLPQMISIGNIVKAEQQSAPQLKSLRNTLQDVSKKQSKKKATNIMLTMILPHV